MIDVLVDGLSFSLHMRNSQSERMVNLGKLLIYLS